jgi:hypothetical protein
MPDAWSLPSRKKPRLKEIASMRHALTRLRLRQQNLAFAGTAGVSGGSRGNGADEFVPAFRDTETGHTVIARYADGRPAPMHLLDGLPAEWAVSQDCNGCITAVKSSIVAGFVRNGAFFTREEAASCH